MATINRPVSPLQLSPDVDASLWFTRLDDTTDPGEEIRSALVSRDSGIDTADDRLLIFRTVLGLIREVVGPAEDDDSWRATFQAIDEERPDRPLFREYT